MTEPVLYETRGAVAIITLNRPVQRNSVNIALANSLRNAVARFESDPEIRVGVLTGAGDVFCAGMDLRAFLDGEGDAILFGQNRFAGFVDLDRTKPVIAAVNGPALAGGFEIALACDLIVASNTAFFGLPEVGVGIFALAGGPFRLSCKIPPAKALELALTADRLSAAEALAFGLVSRLAPKEGVLDAALDLADRITRNAPLGVAASLAVCSAAAAVGERELWDLSEQLWPDVAASADAAEGLQAFTDKRMPKWTGS